tara:strand:- start:1098 stop:2084 length:987 start_codon:yes stop_codon:yes gene_type:complete
MAGITTTQTFSDGDTVTAAKLNNIVANASIDNGAITNAKLGTDAVTLTKMANNSVDTAELIDDAVANSKLATMEKRRVKVNATDATANPTDLFVDANKLLVGTSNSINAVGFNTDLELDASNSTATLVRASDGLINGKSVATPVAANDSVLFYDANGTGNKLRKATVKSTIQSLDATSSESGVVSLATTAEIINPTTIVAAADAVGAAVGSPMMAKAWVSMSYDEKWDDDTGTVTVGSSFNLGTPTHNFATNRGLITFPFSTNLKSGLTSYCVMISAHFTDDDSDPVEISYGIVTARSNSSFTVQFKNYKDSNVNPAQVDIVVFSVGS